MAKQAVVIGLGQFGMAVARSLTDKKVEVLAVDSIKERVQSASEVVADALCFDATDEAALGRIAPERRDVCLCAIGEDSREASIICTALLRQMGAPRIVSRAMTDLHERILKLVGAHEVVRPEREFGERFASHLICEGVLSEMALGESLVLSELEAPKVLIGRTLKELQLPLRHNVTIVAVRDGQRGDVRMPVSTDPIRKGELLITASRPGAVARMLEQL